MKTLLLTASILLGYTTATAQAKDTTASKFTIGAGSQLTLNKKPEVRIYAGAQLVAYRKYDSAWVLINADKTRFILDSLYKSIRK